MTFMDISMLCLQDWGVPSSHSTSFLEAGADPWWPRVEHEEMKWLSIRGSLDWTLGNGLAKNRELNSIVLMGLFQFKIFYDD